MTRARLRATTEPWPLRPANGIGLEVGLWRAWYGIVGLLAAFGAMAAVSIPAVLSAGGPAGGTASSGQGSLSLIIQMIVFALLACLLPLAFARRLEPGHLGLRSGRIWLIVAAGAGGLLLMELGRLIRHTVEPSSVAGDLESRRRWR